MGGKPDGQTNPQSVKPLSVKLGYWVEYPQTHTKTLNFDRQYCYQRTAIDSIVETLFI